MAFAQVVSIALYALVLSGQMPQDQESFIASRQEELTSYGKLLFRVDMGEKSWTHHVLQPCEVLRHHAFALYEHTAQSGIDRFVVIYNLDVPPAKSLDRPWEGGLRALPLRSEWGSAKGTRPDEEDLMKLFNRVLTEERSASKGSRDLQPSLGLEGCFLSLAGEAPLAPAEQKTSEEISDKTLSLGGTIAPVRAMGPEKRFQVLRFDRHGLIEYARVFVSPE